MNSEVVKNFLNGYSIEVTPNAAAKIESFAEVLPANTRIYIAHIEGTPFEEMLKTAKKITDELGGMGIFGVEFFIKNNNVIFSELSPRPHDTGMVTMKTQRLSEFDLHVRAFLELPITQNMIDSDFSSGASHVVLAGKEGNVHSYEGINEALSNDDIDIRIFGKTTTRKHRRMAVVLSSSLDEAKKAAKKIDKI